MICGGVLGGNLGTSRTDIRHSRARIVCSASSSGAFVDANSSSALFHCPSKKGSLVNIAVEVVGFVLNIAFVSSSKVLSAQPHC